MKTMIADLRQLASLRAGEITPRHGKLLAEAANQIELLTELLHQRERECEKWRVRAIQAEGKIKLRVGA